MKKLIALLALAVLVAGCATDPLTALAVAEANAKVAAVPTLTLNCTAGCTAAYTDPRDRKQTAMPTNGYDVALGVVNAGANVATSAVPYAAGAVVLRKAFEGAGHNSDISNTASGPGSSTGGSASYSQVGPDSQNQANSISNTASGQGSSTGGAGSFADRHDAVSVPTVVPQPTPVIVQPTVVQTCATGPC